MHCVSFSVCRITSSSLPMIWLSVFYSFFVLVPHSLNFSFMYPLLVLQSSFLYLDLSILSSCLIPGFLLTLYFPFNDFTLLFMFFKSSDIPFWSGLSYCFSLFWGVFFHILLSSVLKKIESSSSAISLLVLTIVCRSSHTSLV